MNLPEQHAVVRPVRTNDLLDVGFELIEIVFVDVARLGRLRPTAVMVTRNRLGRLVQKDPLVTMATVKEHKARADAVPVADFEERLDVGYEVLFVLIEVNLLKPCGLGA